MACRPEKAAEARSGAAAGSASRLSCPRSPSACRRADGRTGRAPRDRRGAPGRQAMATETNPSAGPVARGRAYRREPAGPARDVRVVEDLDDVPPPPRAEIPAREASFRSGDPRREHSAAAPWHLRRRRPGITPSRTVPAGRTRGNLARDGAGITGPAAASSGLPVRLSLRGRGAYPVGLDGEPGRFPARDMVGAQELPQERCVAAREAGVTVSPVDGDQPSLLIGLVTWAQVPGLEIVCAGKSSECDFVHVPAAGTVECNGTTCAVPGFAELDRLGASDAAGMVARRADATAALPPRAVPDLCEMTIVVDACGMRPGRADLHCPIACIDEAASILGLRGGHPVRGGCALRGPLPARAGRGQLRRRCLRRRALPARRGSGASARQGPCPRPDRDGPHPPVTCRAWRPRPPSSRSRCAGYPPGPNGPATTST